MTPSKIWGWWDEAQKHVCWFSHAKTRSQISPEYSSHNRTQWRFGKLISLSWSIETAKMWMMNEKAVNPRELASISCCSYADAQEFKHAAFIFVDFIYCTLLVWRSDSSGIAEQWATDTNPTLMRRCLALEASLADSPRGNLRRDGHTDFVGISVHHLFVL